MLIADKLLEVGTSEKGFNIFSFRGMEDGKTYEVALPQAEAIALVVNLLGRFSMRPAASARATEAPFVEGSVQVVSGGAAQAGLLLQFGALKLVLRLSAPQCMDLSRSLAQHAGPPPSGAH